VTLRRKPRSWRRSKGLAVAAAAAFLGLAPACALAQLAAGAAGSNAPIDIEADTSTFDNATCASTWTGAPEVLQGDTRLRAEVIKLFAKKKPQAPAAAKPAVAPAPGGPPGPAEAGAGCGATDRVEASGKVFYVTPTQVVHGDNAVYTADDGLIVMTGNVIVVQGKDVLTCDKMTIQVATRHVDCVSSAKGRGTPGRVRGVFYPGQPGQPGIPGLAAGPSAPAATASAAVAAAPGR